MSEQQHQSDPRILNRRTLARDHAGLAGFLAPGMSVLDVGCGTGAITLGIAQAVGSAGTVVGMDRNQGLIEIARSTHAAVSHLTFEVGDATELPFENRFDIVTAARTLQWVADVETALAAMKRASKPGGHVVVLDYNHARNQWSPDPPSEFTGFYRAFLAWRASNQWDNEIADHLPRLFEAAGLVDVHSHVQDETTTREDADFVERTALWTEVIDNLSTVLVDAGACTPAQLAEARSRYEEWRLSSLSVQLLSMRTVTGRVP
ncbi:MAG: methyltransferase domain-containing protein [Bryobacterales bacterium]|nr:methyltransferase domain-containing protein [Bryobacterales bacterium]